MQAKNLILLTLIITISAIAYFSFNSRPKTETKNMSRSNQTNTEAVSTIREENGIQYIRIFARGGYTPRKIQAKANTPTVLEVETKGTYDCSTSFTIPTLNYRKGLPPTGITTVDIPAQSSGSKITGLCSMGMYSFDIVFDL